MSYPVFVTAAAERDLASIHRWIAREAGRATADGFLDRLAKRIVRLKDYPMRGVVPH